MTWLKNNDIIKRTAQLNSIRETDDKQQMKSNINILCYGLIGLLLLVNPGLVVSNASLGGTYQEALAKLQSLSIADKSTAIEQLTTFKEPKTIAILQALLDGHLMVLKADHKVVIGKEIDTGYQLSDAETGQDLGSAERFATQKITLNNSLRVSLRKTLGRLQLNAEKSQVRINAVHAIAKAIDDEGLSLLREHLKGEKDEAVQNEVKLVLGLEQLISTDKTARLEAIALLKDHANQDVVNRLNTLVETDADGNYVETDSDVRNSAKTALAKINSRLQWYAGIETLFFGLSLGAVLVLAAIGLAITFGVMGVINMAHGELMMLGAYTTYVMQQMMPGHIGLALILSIPAAFMISGLVGIAIERGIIRFLYGRPLETLLATFGVSLFLQQTVRSIFSPLNRSVTAPDWMSGTWQINDFLAITWNRFYILIFCLLVFCLLLQILKHTRLGLEVRAVAQNRNMAKAMGIPTGWVDALTFGLGSGIAGIAGVALSQITNVGPNLGQSYIVDSFMVVVFGGVGNIWGTLLAGFSLGVANKLLEPYAGAVLAKILVLVFIILFIQKYPRGLFPQKGRAAEN
jgi:urea transport system permease protein